MQITLGNSHAPCMWPFHVALARDPCTWPHLVTPASDFCAAQLNLWSWVDWTPLHDFAKSATSLERRKSLVSARDVSRDFFYSRWASFSINLVYLLGWPFYNKIKDSGIIQQIKYIMVLEKKKNDNQRPILQSVSGNRGKKLKKRVETWHGGKKKLGNLTVLKLFSWQRKEKS